MLMLPPVKVPALQLVGDVPRPLRRIKGLEVQLDFDDEDVEPDVRAPLPTRIPRALAQCSLKPAFK